MTRFDIEAERLPEWDDDEVRRRLGRVYALILSHDSQARHAEGTDPACEKAGDQTQTEGVPLEFEPDSCEAVSHGTSE